MLGTRMIGSKACREICASDQLACGRRFSASAFGLAETGMKGGISQLDRRFDSASLAPNLLLLVGFGGQIGEAPNAAKETQSKMALT
jgi:hypothetical protein